MGVFKCEIGAIQLRSSGLNFRTWFWFGLMRISSRENGVKNNIYCLDSRLMT